jgi:hypothetical protein
LSEVPIPDYGESYQRFYKFFGKTMLLAKNETGRTDDKNPKTYSRV